MDCFFSNNTEDIVWRDDNTAECQRDIAELRQDPAELNMIRFWQGLLLGDYLLGWKKP